MPCTLFSVEGVIGKGISAWTVKALGCNPAYPAARSGENPLEVMMTVPLCVDRHQLHVVLLVKVLHHLAHRGGKIYRIILGVVDQACVLHTGGVAHNGQHAVVVIAAHSDGEGDDEQRKKDQDDQKAVVKPASGYFFCGQPDTSRYSLVKVCRDYSDTLHLYPYPQTVVRYLGLEGSSSIFMRRRRMLTSTILTSPK